MMNVSLDTANNNTVNISILDFRIWQHFSSNWTPSHLQKLANVPEVHVAKLYRDKINISEPVHSFTIGDDDEDSSLIWTILVHHGTYIGTIGMILAVCIGVNCFERFWTRPMIGIASWDSIVSQACDWLCSHVWPCLIHTCPSVSKIFYWIITFMYGLTSEIS